MPYQQTPKHNTLSADIDQEPLKPFDETIETLVSNGYRVEFGTIGPGQYSAYLHFETQRRSPQTVSGGSDTEKHIAMGYGPTVVFAIDGAMGHAIDIYKGLGITYDGLVKQD